MYRVSGGFDSVIMDERKAKRRKKKLMRRRELSEKEVQLLGIERYGNYHPINAKG